MSAPTQETTHRADIDGLRGLAVSAVVAFHAAPTVFAHGYLGVDVFFVISGYLITQILLRELKTGRIDLKQFYMRRVRRIFPPLICVLAAVLGYGWFALLPPEFWQLGQHVTAASTFVSNFVLMSEVGYFDVGAELKPLLHLWSLAIEEQFYLVWPLLLLLLGKTQRRVTLLTFLMLIASLAIDVGLHSVDPDQVFFVPMARAWELLLGAALAVSLGDSASATRISTRLRHPLLIVATLVFLGAVGVLAYRHDLDGMEALVPVTAAMVLIGTGPEPWLQRRVLGSSPLVWLGGISYPLYLWHWPFFSFLRITEGPDTPVWLKLVSIALSVLLAWLVWRFVERPIRARPATPRMTASLVGALLALGVTGAVVSSGQGFPQRIDPSVRPTMGAIEDTRHSDGSCEKWLGYSVPAQGVCRTKSDAPEIMFLGDSHAMALNSANDVGVRSLNSLMLGAHGWLPFTEFGPTEDAVPGDQSAIARDGVRLVERLPSIKTIVLVTRGPFYFVGGTPNEFNPTASRRVEWNGARMRQPREAFIFGYSSLISTLLKTGRRVVFFVEWPELGFDPNDCFEHRPLTLTHHVRSPCTLPRADVEQRQSDYRKIVEVLQKANPGLLIYDNPSLYCDAASCGPLKDEQVLYFDDDHLSVDGSARALDDLMRWLTPP